MRRWVALIPGTDITHAADGSRVAISDAMTAGRARSFLINYLHLVYLDEVAELCEQELLDAKNISKGVVQQVRVALRVHGMDFTTHHYGGECIFFSPRNNTHPIRREQADAHPLREVVSLQSYGVRDAFLEWGHWSDYPSTLGQFRSLTKFEQLEILTPAGINQLNSVIRRWQLGEIV